MSYIEGLFSGTVEVGGLTVIQGLEIVRGCKGLNIIGADLVEVCQYSLDTQAMCIIRLIHCLIRLVLLQ